MGKWTYFTPYKGSDFFPYPYNCLVFGLRFHGFLGLPGIMLIPNCWTRRRSREWDFLSRGNTQKKQQKPQVSTGENSWFRKWKGVILRFFVFLSKAFNHNLVSLTILKYDKWHLTLSSICFDIFRLNMIKLLLFSSLVFSRWWFW